MKRILLSALLTLCTVAMFCYEISLGGDVDPAQNLPIADGPFKPTRQSLQQYKYPDWFRDAKFGIWAHWGPQAVPMEGDWYARKIYEQGSPDYVYHLAHYGHPSKFGYKDIIPLWKAQKWDPDRLMSLYKKAGAKYFVSMGTHHDDFFLWNSKLHRWNSVNMGPHRDVVGEWQKAARKYRLPFGVSEHLAASFTWFQESHQSDKTGPLAGVPYDGADPANQDLYHFPAEPGDTAWYSNNPRWQRQWYAEIKELLDNYHPDLLYSDGGVPFGNDVGLSLIAHFYNINAATHEGVAQAIYTCKEDPGGRWVQDRERGAIDSIDSAPWQMDTSIGDWFYNRHWTYRPINWTIHTLVDTVSKNGNMLLNVVLRPDGSLDPQVEQMLDQLADWSASQGEAIFGTRPWLVYGEGNVRVKKAGMFNESEDRYTAADIRFTTKKGKLYAICMAWPDDGKMVVRSLAAPAGKISEISLVGSTQPVQWEQTAGALVVTLPAKPISKFTCALRITGDQLKPVPLPPPDPFVAHPTPDGNFILDASDADLHGDQIGTETHGGRTNIAYWFNPQSQANWLVNFPIAGTYRVSIETASINPDTPLLIGIGDTSIEAIAKQTGDWQQYTTSIVGSIKINQPGKQFVTVKPRDPKSWHAINLTKITLTMEKPGS